MTENSWAINWLIAFYVAYILCALVPDILPTVAAMYIPIAVLSICCIFFFKECFTNKAFICACIYALAICLASQFHILSGLGYGYGGMDTVLIDLGFTLPSVAVGAILLNNKRILSSLRLLDIVICLSIILTACWMVPTLLYDRSLARAVAIMETGKMDEQLLEFKFGYWNYTMCHIISLFFALFFGLYITSTSATRKIFYGAMTIIVVFFILNLTIATTFTYFFIVLALLICYWSKRFSVLGLIFIAIGSIVIMLNIDNILNYLWDNYKDTDMESKIADFIDILNGGTERHGTIESRIDYQRDAINGFFNNILIGSEYTGGGHSIILNRLGTTGLLGFVPFVLMLYFIFIQWYRTIPESSRFYYLLSWLGVAILVYDKNTFGSSGFCFICIIMPCLCFTFSYPKTLWPPIYK